MTRTHGIRSTYVHSCRCDQCRAASREYSRAWRRRHGIMPPGNPVMDGGVVYPSQTAFAAAKGISQRAVSYHLTKHAHFDGVGKRRGGGKGGPRKPVEIAGRTWPSIRSLAIYCGVAPATIRRWIRDSPRRLLYAIRATDERLIAERMAADAKAAARRMVA